MRVSMLPASAPSCTRSCGTTDENGPSSSRWPSCRSSFSSSPSLPSSSASAPPRVPPWTKPCSFSLLYLLLIPVVMPATLAAYTVAGEREQGTLEPLLTTPLRRQEFILGKAAAVMIPSVALSYTVFGLFLAAVALFAHPAVASAVFHQGPVLLALFLFAPLVAGWAIVVGMAISVRASEVPRRPAAGNASPASPFSAWSCCSRPAPSIRHLRSPCCSRWPPGNRSFALRIVPRMFDRERLVTGAKATTSRPTRRSPQPRTSTSGRPSSDGTVTVATATLQLSRRWGRATERKREWQIVMDGTTVGSIANQTRIEIPVEAGHHTLQLSSQKHLSPQRHFQAADGGDISFSCHGLALWPMYAAALFKPDLWILAQARLNSLALTPRVTALQSEYRSENPHPGGDDFPA